MKLDTHALLSISRSENRNAKRWTLTNGKAIGVACRDRCQIKKNIKLECRLVQGGHTRPAQRATGSMFGALGRGRRKERYLQVKLASFAERAEGIFLP